MRNMWCENPREVEPVSRQVGLGKVGFDARGVR